MPDINADFCTGGFLWLRDVVSCGGALHFLCSDGWHGVCTRDDRAGPHGFVCREHFHKRRFAVPLEFHGPALATFWSSAAPGPVASGQLREYCAAALRTYPVHKVLAHAQRHARLRPFVHDALASLAPGDRALLRLRASDVLSAAETGVVPRSLMPRGCSDIADHAELSGDVLRACAYVEWMRNGTPVHRDDFPALGAAVSAALAPLPAEIAVLIAARVFLPGTAQSPGAGI